MDKSSVIILLLLAGIILPLLSSAATVTDFRNECMLNGHISGLCTPDFLYSNWLEPGYLGNIWWDLTTSERGSVAGFIVSNFLTQRFTQWGIGQSFCSSPPTAWQNAVCYNNAVIRYLTMGNSPYDPQDVTDCYYKTSDGYIICPPETPWGLPVYPVGVQSTNAPEGTYFNHAIAAIQIGTDKTRFTHWRFFQYSKNNIQPGDGQMPCTFLGNNIRVMIAMDIDVINCYGWPETNEKVEWIIGSNCIPVYQGCQEGTTQCISGDEWTCAGNTWKRTTTNDPDCWQSQGCAPDGKTRCEGPDGTDLYTCVKGKWVLTEEDSPSCSGGDTQPCGSCGTQLECVGNGCFWWPDSTCHDEPMSSGYPCPRLENREINLDKAFQNGWSPRVAPPSIQKSIGDSTYHLLYNASGIILSFSEKDSVFYPCVTWTEPVFITIEGEIFGEDNPPLLQPPDLDIDVTTNVVAVAAAMLSGIAFIGFLAFSRI